MPEGWKGKRLVYACQRVGWARILNICFRLCVSIFSDQGAVWSGDLYIRRRRFRSIHAIGTGGKALCTVLICTSAVEVSRIGGRVPVDRYSRRRHFWYMHTSISGGRASVLNVYILLFVRRSIFPDRGRCFRGTSTIGDGAFGGYMTVVREGKRAEPFHFCFHR